MNWAFSYGEREVHITLYCRIVALYSCNRSVGFLGTASVKSSFSAAKHLSVNVTECFIESVARTRDTLSVNC